MFLTVEVAPLRLPSTASVSSTSLPESEPSLSPMKSSMIAEDTQPMEPTTITPTQAVVLWLHLLCRAHKEHTPDSWECLWMDFLFLVHLATVIQATPQVKLFACKGAIHKQNAQTKRMQLLYFDQEGYDNGACHLDKCNGRVARFQTLCKPHSDRKSMRTTQPSTKHKLPHFHIFLFAIVGMLRAGPQKCSLHHHHNNGQVLNKYLLI